MLRITISEVHLRLCSFNNETTRYALGVYKHYVYLGTLHRIDSITSDWGTKVAQMLRNMTFVAQC